MNVQQKTTRLYAGWHRESPSRPWRRLVQADDYAECRDLVCARVDGGEVRVLPTGECPRDGRRERRRAAPGARGAVMSYNARGRGTHPRPILVTRDAEVRRGLSPERVTGLRMGNIKLNEHLPVLLARGSDAGKILHRLRIEDEPHTPPEEVCP